MADPRKPSLARQQRLREPLPPVISTEAQFFIALWRFKRELEALDWQEIHFDEDQLEELRWAIGQIMELMQQGLEASTNARW